MSRYPVSRAPRVRAMSVKPCSGTWVKAEERIVEATGEKGGGGGACEWEW